VTDAFLSNPAAFGHRIRWRFSHIAAEQQEYPWPIALSAIPTPDTGVTTARIGRVITLTSARTSHRPGTVKCYVLNVQCAMAAATASTPSR
jgi:hypothetical protein